MSTMKKQTMLLFLAVIASSILTAEDVGLDYPKIKAVVKPESSTIGVPLEYRINIAGKNLKEINIILPEKKELYPEKEEALKNPKPAGIKEEENPAEEVPLYVIHNARKENKNEQGLDSITIILQMAYYRPGKYPLPDIDIKDKDNIKIGYKVPEIEIKELNPSGEQQDIEPPFDLGGNYTRLIILLFSVAILTGLGFFLYGYIRKRREAEKIRAAFVPPIDIFLKEVGDLHGAQLIAGGKIEEYVFGISMIFRKFLSLQLSIDAAEMTSDELIRELRRVLPLYLFSRYEQDFDKSFQLLDLAKFAEFTPSVEILTANLDGTVRLAMNLSRDMNNGTV